MRVGNGALFCSLKYISSAFRFCAGGSFFFAVGPFGPAAFFISLSRGRVAAGVQQKPKKEPHMAKRNTNPGIGENANPGVMHNPQPSRARTRTSGMSYGDMKFKGQALQKLSISDKIEDNSS